MAGMDAQEKQCTELIGKVREVYDGLVMHNVNHGDEMRYGWLTEVDVIGISAYYPCTDARDRSLERMNEVWSGIAERLEKVHNHYQKPIMFAEIGVRNERGCTEYPWDFKYRPEAPLDEREQADFYEAAMAATFDKPWFCGYFWWDWKAILPAPEKAHENRDFTVYGKQAEQVLKKWYTK
jgi:hypothetical protein